MSYIVTPFEVSSKGLEAPVNVHFVHLYSAIATRHSDTIDAIFLVDGRKATVAVSCATLSELRAREHKDFTDQQLANIAALHLRRTLERGYDATEAELFLSGEDFRALARELGYLKPGAREVARMQAQGAGIKVRTQDAGVPRGKAGGSQAVFFPTYDL